MADESSPAAANAMASKSSLSQMMMMSSGNLDTFDDQIMSDIFRSSCSSRMFSSSVSSTAFFRGIEDHSAENSPEKRRSTVQPPAPQLLSNADLPEDHDDMMTTMITKSFQKHMSISSAEESSSSDEVEVIGVVRAAPPPVRLPAKACCYPETVVTSTTVGSSSQAATIQENEVFHDSITTTSDADGGAPPPPRRSQSNTSNGTHHQYHSRHPHDRGAVEILNLDHLAHVLHPDGTRKRASAQDQNSRAFQQRELPALDPDPIAPGLGRDESMRFVGVVAAHNNNNNTYEASRQQQQQPDFNGEESLRFGEDSMSMLRPRHQPHCAVVTPSHPNVRRHSAPVDQDSLLSHRSFPGLGTTDLHGNPTSPNQAFHSSMPAVLNHNSNSSLQYSNLAPPPPGLGSTNQVRHHSLNLSNSSLQTPAAAFNNSGSSLAPPPPTLGSTSPVRHHSLNLSNSSLQTPAASFNNSGSSLHASSSIEDNPAYVAAAERLTRSMQRSMNSRINVKQHGGLLSSMPESASASDKQQPQPQPTQHSEHYDMQQLHAVPSDEYFRLMQRQEEPL